MKTVNKWEIDFFHVDSYQQGVLGTDLNLLKQYFMSWNGTIIGNNSVIDTKSAEAVLNTGAEFFSVARAAQENIGIFKEIIKN
jgi:tRNA-dihydrouridine synthase